MEKSLKIIRPVGNPIVLAKGPLDYTQFGGFHIEFYHSGTSALAAAILAVKRLRPTKNVNPEIILPAYACPDLISAVAYAGCTPILVDLAPDTCWMSLTDIENHISENTIAIIAVRFLGIAERMEQLKALCEKHELILIEDSAQGFPVTNPGTYWRGDVNILSFGRGKPINMLAGGAVLTKVEAIKNHLILPSPHIDKSSESIKYLLKVFAYNILINPFIYGIALNLPGLSIGETIFKPLPHIANIPGCITDRINTNINAYRKLPNKSLEIKQIIESLKSLEITDLAVSSQHEFSNPLLRYPLLVKDKATRDSLHKALMQLGSSIMYQQPLYKIRNIPAAVGMQNINFVHADNFANRLITLPTHKDVSNNILDEIFARIRQIIE